MKRKKLCTFTLISVTSIGLFFFTDKHWVEADCEKPKIIILEDPILTPKNSEDNSASLPLSVQLDIPLLNQMDDPILYNGCEVTSLAMMLQYVGVDVTKNELSNAIKTVPLQDEDGYMGNPNKAFVGDMTGIGGPGLGVYHQPIASLAKDYIDSEKVKDISGSDFNDLLIQLAAGNPVWIITTANFVPVDTFQTWKTTDGDVDITYDMHSVVITGYDEDYIYVNNPYGEKNQQLEKDDFIAAFEQMGSQAIYFDYST